LIFILILYMTLCIADKTCLERFNELLEYDTSNDDIMDDRAYIFHVSMAKHKHDLGNYQF